MKERKQICLKDICVKHRKDLEEYLGCFSSSAELEVLELALVGGDELSAVRTQYLKKLHAMAQVD